MIRVLHLFSGDLWAGAEVMILNLFREFRRDASVELIGVSLNEGTLSNKLQAEGFEVHTIPERQHSLFGIIAHCAKLFWARDIHVIHAHRYKENLLGACLSKLIGARCMMATVHGVSEEVSPDRAGGRRWVPHLNRWNLRHGCDCVVAVSEELRSALIETYGVRTERVCVIHNGVPDAGSSRGRKQSESERVHIGSVGRMVAVKDFGLFLETAALLDRSRTNIRVSILGEGPLRERLIAEIKELGIDDYAELQGPLEDAGPYYESLDIYVNTSVHEGLPLSILEAMSYGIPIVAPRVGGIPEIVVHGVNGYLVECRKPGEFARFCARLIEDRALRRSMGDSAAQRVKALFSSAKMADSYRRLYDSLWRGSYVAQVPVA